MTPESGRRLSLLPAVLLALTLVVASCAKAVPEVEEDVVTVGTDGFTVTTQDVTVVGQAGVAEEGTIVDVTPAPTIPALHTLEYADQLAGGIQVLLGEGQQPSAPIELRFAIDSELLDPDEDGNYAILTASLDGTTDALAATLDPETSELVAVTEHLSWFWPFRLDVGKIAHDIASFGADLFEVTYPDPGCDRTTTVDDVVYEVFTSSAAYLCLQTTDDGLIELAVHPAINLPYSVSTSPRVDADNRVASATGILSTAVGFQGIQDGYTPGILAGGSTVLFQFSPDDPPQSVTLQQRPELLFVDLLLASLERIHRGISDLVAAAECVGGVVETGINWDDASPFDSTEPFARAALTCLASAADGMLSILLGMVAPLLRILVSTFLSITESVQDRAAYTVHIERTEPVAPPPQAEGSVVALDGAVHCKVAIGEIFSHDGTSTTEILTCTMTDVPATQYPNCHGPTTVAYFEGQMEAYCDGDVDYSGAVPLVGDEILELGSFTCHLGPGYESVACANDRDGGLYMSGNFFTLSESVNNRDW